MTQAKSSSPLLSRHRLRLFVGRVADFLLSRDGATRRQIYVRCAVAALLLVVSVYPDVIFARASLSAANLVNAVQGTPGNRVSIFPALPGREA